MQGKLSLLLFGNGTVNSLRLCENHLRAHDWVHFAQIGDSVLLP